MRDKFALFIVKAKLSFRSITWLMARWRYAILAAFSAILFFELIFWLFNLPVLSFVMLSDSLTIIEKIKVLISPLSTISDSNGTIVLLMMLTLAIIQGIIISALVYTIRHQQKVDGKLIGESSAIGILAIIGLGCPSCGTSLLTPIIALFASGSATAVSEQLTIFAMPIAILIGIYGLYSIGLKVSSAKAHHATKQLSESPG